ncbi:MAG: methionine synthase [Actinomycetota bacterium]
MSSRSDIFRTQLTQRVLIADGAMGTMLQAADPSLDDFQGHEGCNEVLNVTRGDVVRSVHEAYLAVGVDAIETNTFGTNHTALGEYDITHRIAELAGAGARIARAAADAWSTDKRPRFVLGSMGPGTKLPSLGHAPYAVLRDGYYTQAAAMIEGGVDALLIETAQDLLQAKAAVIGSRRALQDTGEDLPVIVQVTVETTGTMLLGSEIGAALTALEALGIDVIGLNCATGPAEMSEHLRHLSKHARIPISAMPNAGLPQLSRDGAYYPLTPDELAAAHERFVTEYGLALVGGCCGTTPEHLARVVAAVGNHPVRDRRPRPEAGLASLYQHVPFRQDTAYLSIGERTNANGSKAFREAMLEGRLDECVQIARSQTRDGAHVLDVCVDYVGRDGADDIRHLLSRLATSSTLPIMLDSTEPAVIEAGLEMLGGRVVVNSVNYEDGDGPDSRFARIMPVVREHGAAVVVMCIDEEGQARTSERKVAIASRTIDDLVSQWGMDEGDIMVDTLTFPIATGQEETRRDGVETIEAIRELKRHYPRVQTVLGLSNISFGLNPAARVVLNSVFLHECIKAGLDAAIVHTAKILPMSAIDDEQRQVALDMVYDRRRWQEDHVTEHLDHDPVLGGRLTYDPLQRYLELFEGVDSASLRASRAEELAGLPLGERLSRRIVDGERKGLEADLDEGLQRDWPALDIINDHLLEGMRVVGDLFGRGEMQLPFVLQSAEVMKAAVAHLEPHIDNAADDTTTRRGKATIVLATVKGDVHDIGKNLVDIILSNNGYDVVNLGIKQPVGEILRAVEEHHADAVGMSGLLVKSTVIMKENLQEINARGLATTLPVLLGGAALTRAYVEDDLAEIYQGEVRYARDAFEGLRLMDAIAQAKADPALSVAETLPPLRKRRVRRATVASEEPAMVSTTRSDVAVDVSVPTPPFWGTRVIKGIALADYAAYLDERATFLGQWGLKASRSSGPSYEELVETEGRPRLRSWLERVHTDGLMEAAVVYGYFPVASDGNDLIVLHHEGPNTGKERARFSFPRQRRDRRLCLADFFKSTDSGETDVLPMHLVTMGNTVSVKANELYTAGSYRDYLELHGLSVQLTEALAEFWHSRIRMELGFADDDATDLPGILDQGYRGSRYSFGYPACPNLEDRRALVDLLEPSRIGVVLSDELQLHPEQSTDAIIVHHPEAKYFNAT